MIGTTELEIITTNFLVYWNLSSRELVLSKASIYFPGILTIDPFNKSFIKKLTSKGKLIFFQPPQPFDIKIFELFFKLNKFRLKKLDLVGLFNLLLGGFVIVSVLFVSLHDLKTCLVVIDWFPDLFFVKNRSKFERGWGTNVDWTNVDKNIWTNVGRGD